VDKICTYDNPKTMMRECYRNGNLEWDMCAEIFFISWSPPIVNALSGFELGYWKEGEIVGDPEALPEEYLKVGDQ